MQTSKGWQRVGLVLALGGCATAQAATLVLDTGFESSETPSYVNGEQLHHAGGVPYTWNWSGDNIGTISTAPAAVNTGAQGLDATRTSYNGSQSWWTRPGNAFDPLTSGSVEIEVAVKASGWGGTQNSFLEIAASSIAADNFGANSTRSSFVTLKGDQKLYAWNGNGTESVLATGLTLTDWNVIRLDINLQSSTYDVYLNNALVADHFGFFGGAGVTSVGSLQFKEYNNGATSGGVYLDDISVQWSPVPEPGTAALLSVAGALLLGGRRLRRLWRGARP